jgi:quercetin dioxygenase-like cupin family protein
MYQKPSSKSTAKKLPIEQDAWLLHSLDNLEMIRLHLAPGEAMEKHVNDWSIVFYVLKGQGSLDVEGMLFKLGEGQSIAVEEGRERFWSNPGEHPLELLVIKSKFDQ